MADILTEVELDSDRIKDQIMLLNNSYNHWFIDSMVPFSDPLDLAIKLYHAPFAFFSIDEQAEPRYNFMNLRAQSLFEVSWDQIGNFPLRDSTEKILQNGLINFTNQMKNVGKYSNYSGLRISTSGKRFRLENAYVWVVFDANGKYRGQGYMEPLF